MKELKKRKIIYVSLTIALLFGFLLLQNFDWQGTKQIHTIMELTSTLLAVFAGIAALIRYYSRKNNTFLFIGTGFLGTGFLDGYHAVVTSTFFDSYFPSPPPSLIPWSWIASRLFLSLMMFLSWWAWNREDKLGADARIKDGKVYLIAIISTLTSFLFFAFVPLPRAYYPELFFHRPEEFIPALFFIAALIGYIKKGYWKTNQFEHWVIISLIIGSFSQVVYMSLSGVIFDTMFDAAHMLKIASYICLEIGLLINTFFLFRKAETSALDLKMANEELHDEILDRKLAEKALLESKEQINSVMDNIVDGIITIDGDGILETFNPAAEKIFGYNSEEIIGKNVNILMPKPYHSEHDSYLHNFHTTREKKIIGIGRIVKGKKKDGTIFPMDLAVSEIISNDKTIFTGIVRDITERVEAEIQLANSEKRYRSIVEEASDIVYTVDDEGRITYINPPGLKMSGYSKEELIGMEFTDIVHPDWREAVKSYYEKQQNELLKETSYEFPILTVNKELKWVEQTVSLQMEGEKYLGFQAIVRDITERKFAERELRKAYAGLERANQAKSNFLASMSHELRTPLNSVIGFANILLKNKDKSISKKNLNYINRIDDNGKHLLKLINDILDLSKIEAGRMDLVITSVSLNSLVNETIREIKGQLENTNVRLIAEVTDNLTPVETDAGKLKQILINLIGNSIKFTEKGIVTIKVVSDEEGRIVERIEVIDTGIGIHEDKLSNIFQAFIQAEEGTSRKYEGTGLGLAISKSLCDILGYELSVKSEINKGSTFTISNINSQNGLLQPDSSVESESTRDNQKI